MSEADDALEHIKEGIESGRGKGLNRAVAFIVIFTELDGASTGTVDRLDQMATDVWDRHALLPDEELAQIGQSLFESFRFMYPPMPSATSGVHDSAPKEPVSAAANANALPITDEERDWILHALESEDNLRELCEYGVTVDQNGSLPVIPLLVVDDASVYGHRIAPLYRQGRVRRPWGCRRRRWEYALIEDFLLCRTAVEGKLTGRSRNIYAAYLKPYVRGLPERDLLRHTRRIERGLVRKGMLVRLSSQAVRCEQVMQRIVLNELVPIWTHLGSWT